MSWSDPTFIISPFSFIKQFVESLSPITDELDVDWLMREPMAAGLATRFVFDWLVRLLKEELLIFWPLVAESE